MKRNRTNVSSARKSAASAPGEIEAFLEEKAVVNTCKQLEDEIKKLGLRIKRHEDKIKSLMRERNETCEAIQDLQASELVKVHHIRKNENSAAGNLSELITSHGTKAFHNLQNCGVVGTVATLGKVDDGNISREEPQIIFPECSGTSGPPADYASLEEQIRKKGLEWEVLQEELQREVACLDNVKSEFLVKKKEYLQFLDEASPQCAGSAVQVPAHSED